MHITIENEKIELKNLDKYYFEKQGYQKADIINYYIKIAPYLLPHLKDRPFSMIYYPEGSVENSFYQKECPAGAPDYLQTIKIPSNRRGHINWCMVNNLPSLVYLVNKSIIEMHAWFSRARSLDKPDMAVIDLDPSGNSGISEAVVIANAFHTLLYEMKIQSVPKTSGSRGLHIFIPIKPVHDYKEIQKFLGFLCEAVKEAYPDLCTTERIVAKRGNRIYLDAIQCGYGKTLAMPYSLRVKSGALVSTPLEWNEVNASLNPADFNIQTIFDRINSRGDLFEGFYSIKQELPIYN